VGSLKAESRWMALRRGLRVKEGQEAAKAGPRTLLTRLSEQPKEPMGLAYAGLALFMVVYCLRPEDWFPGLDFIPLAKICALLAIAGFLYSWMTQGLGGTGFPRELIYLVVLFAHLVLCIPFAIWKGGSFQVVVQGFSEVVILTIALALALKTIKHLRRLLFVQTASVVAITIISLVNNNLMRAPGEGIMRVQGAGNGIFENPNDLAVSIAMVFPLCFMFLLRCRGLWRKALWTIVLLVLTRGVLVTYSRGGLLALLAAVLFALYEFGAKGRRPQLFVIVALAMGLLVVFAGPANYGQRMRTIFDPDSDPTGSAQSRRQLLTESLDITEHHPLFGIGPGDFQIVSGFWHETHNTYTQLSAEAGIPALLLFLVLFVRSFKNIKRARALASDDEEIQMLGAALRCTIAAYLLGSFFASTAYEFFPYFLVAYATALYLIARKRQTPESKPEPKLTARPLHARKWQAA
jgi:O-Antigen ligase